MKIPFTTVLVSLPEKLGIIDNVRAIITVHDKQLSINCAHFTRFHSSDGSEWPKIFDNNLSAISNFNVIENDEMNTSVFIGKYFLYNKSYLEGDCYFVFDFYENYVSYKNYTTNSFHFKLDEDDYFDLLELFKNKKGS